MDGEAKAALTRPDREFAAEHRHPLAHARESVPFMAVDVLRRPAAEVGDLDR